MKNIDPKNANTDTERVVLVTNAQTVITDLGTLLSKPDDYIASSWVPKVIIHVRGS